MAARRTPRAGGSQGRLRAAWSRHWVKRSVLVVGVLGALGVLVLVLTYMLVSLPKEPESAQTTVVLDAEGGTIAELFDVQNRVSVTLDEVAPVMRDAVVAAEDHGFYRHGGLDPVGLARAFVNDARGKRLQGGSTITQQLVKNTYLSPERSLVRKAKEAVLAMKVEQQFSKKEILERYLNTVYFGRGAYGIEKASKTYFNVSAKDLTLSQAALLAGLIRSPETADPTTHADVANQRRTIVLDALVKTKKISKAEADAAKAVPVQALPRANIDARLKGSSAYFVAQVRRWLIRRFGEQTAFGGGLKVQTTLRPKMQQAAEKAVFGTLNLPTDPDAALVALDDRGAIVAMIGGRDFNASKVNLALGAQGGGQGRQPGSTFKPFVLAAALESGIPITQRYPGPPHIVVDVNKQKFEVSNFDNESFGDIDLTEATAKSVNTVYAQLVRDVGPQAVADTATKLGVTAPLEPFPALALGTEEVSPLDMARAYMTFANRGERVTPFSVEKVSDAKGNVIYTADVSKERAYPEQYADVVNRVLQDVITKGTGRAAGIRRQAAGKTGTTQSNTDAWFVGYTPKIGAAVWMGYKDGSDQKMTSVHGRAVTGGSFPAQIWQKFMAAAVAGMDTGKFTEPPDELLHPTTSSTAPPPTESTTSSSTMTSSTLPEDSTTTSSSTSTSSSSTSTTTTTQPKKTTTTSTTTQPNAEAGAGPSP